jgi:hypothetical protein
MLGVLLTPAFRQCGAAVQRGINARVRGDCATSAELSADFEPAQGNRSGIR